MFHSFLSFFLVEILTYQEANIVKTFLQNIQFKIDRFSPIDFSYANYMDAISIILIYSIFIGKNPEPEKFDHIEIEDANILFTDQYKTLIESKHLKPVKNMIDSFYIKNYMSDSSLMEEIKFFLLQYRIAKEIWFKGTIDYIFDLTRCSKMDERSVRHSPALQPIIEGDFYNMKDFRISCEHYYEKLQKELIAQKSIFSEDFYNKKFLQILEPRNNEYDEKLLNELSKILRGKAEKPDISVISVNMVWKHIDAFLAVEKLFDIDMDIEYKLSNTPDKEKKKKEEDVLINSNSKKNEGSIIGGPNLKEDDKKIFKRILIIAGTIGVIGILIFVVICVFGINGYNKKKIKK